MSKSSLALNNLRAAVILIVLAVHAFLAYCGSAGLAASAFDKAPYLWRAFPVVDSHRWLGFDIFSGWQDVYLMVLLFFLSALFTWPSLSRKGTGKFLSDRALRLGIPYIFGVAVLMPVALYPAYATRAPDPGIAGYVAQLFALPFWDNGPMWFLWQLLALTIVAAGLHRFAPRPVERLAALCSNAATHPGRYLLWLAAASIVAYVPLALMFGPLTWNGRGLLSLQFSRPLLYLVFYIAGLAAGAGGLDRGLLATDGALPRHWGRWLSAATLSFAVWLGLMGLTVTSHSPALWLQLVTSLAFAVAAASGCLAALALSLRFGGRRSRVMDGLATNAMGLYLVHYPFAVWLQYALLGVALSVFAKATIVFGLSLLASLALLIAMRRVPFGARLLGEVPPSPPRLPHPGRLRVRTERPSAAIRLTPNLRAR